MNKIDLSIIIVNWNASDLLERCLNSIFVTNSSICQEVIVVDNASSDGSQELLQVQYPQVKLVTNQENEGFARANNRGLRLAKGRYHLLLNSDAFVHPGTLENMVQFMDGNPEAGVAGCRLYYENGTLQPSCTGFPTLFTELWQVLWLDRLFPKSRIFGQYRMSYWNFDDVREVDSVMGAFMMLRPEAVVEVGLLDESYFMYSEEVDLCYRMKKAGWKVLFNPDASATHIWGGTSKRIPSRTSFLRLYQSRIMFFRKHYGSFVAFLYKLVLFLGSSLRVAGGIVTFPIMLKKNTFRHTKNYWALLRNLLVI
jgi:GT2 family glycosyltransferase